MMRITRCVCNDLEFEELKRLAAQRGITDLDGLCGWTGCGLTCGLCRPYIGAMLQTGQTVFTELLLEEPTRKPRPKTDDEREWVA